MSKSYPVYVVEDEPGIREVLIELCTERGLVCLPFGNGEDFLAALDGLEPGCVLLDMRLPRRSGLYVQGEIASRGRDFPVIAISGFGGVDMAVECMKMGAIDFLEKPFMNEALFDALDRGFARLSNGSGAASPPA